MKLKSTTLLFLILGTPVALGIIAVILLFFENNSAKIEALSWKNKDGECLVSFDISNNKNTPHSITAIIHIYTQKDKETGVRKKGPTIINEVGKKQFDKALAANETFHAEEHFSIECDFAKVFLLG